MLRNRLLDASAVPFSTWNPSASNCEWRTPRTASLVSPFASTSLPICSATTRRPYDAYDFGVGSAVSAFTAMACQ